MSNSSSLSLSLSLSPPSFAFLFFSSRFLFRPPFMPVLRAIFIRQRGAGVSLSQPYRCAWGVGSSCPATATGEVTNRRGLQGTSSLVSHYKGVWGFRFWKKHAGRERRSSKKEKKKFFLPLLHIQGKKKEEQCRSKRHYFVPFFLIWNGVVLYKMRHFI